VLSAALGDTFSFEVSHRKSDRVILGGGEFFSPD